MRFSVAWAVVLLCAVPLWAVHTSHWTHTTQADFKDGTFHDTVATNLGDVQLSRQVRTLLEQDPRIGAVYALAQGADGTVYAATGPQGVLLKYHDGKVSTVATFPQDINLLSLRVEADGRLLIGTGGAQGRILVIDKPGDKPRELFSDKGVQYVWAMCRLDDGTLYAATGPNGQLFRIDKEGKAAEVLKTEENNLLSLVSDGKTTLYIGTDPNGLIYRVDVRTHRAFVLYDAPETEISALILDDQGNLYAGTSEAAGASTRGVTPASKQQVGRHEGEEGNGGRQLPGKPPEMPEPPALPHPNPDQPPAIPRHDSEATQASAQRSGNPGDGGAFIHPYLFTIADTGDAGEQAEKMDDEDGAENEEMPTTAPEDEEGSSVSLQPESQAARPGEGGNAIYRITPDGFVDQIFQAKVMILSMLQHNGVLLAGTGSNGLIYQIDPRTLETRVIAQSEAKQVMCLLEARDKTILAGTANVGRLASLSGGYAEQGTYTSAILDATQSSRFGMLQMHGTLPDSTSLSVATRSGNTEDPTETGWSDWSPEIPASQFITITSPSARYLQYRLTFKTNNSMQSPTVEDVDIAYLMPNLPPRVRGIQVRSPELSESGQPPEASSDRLIAWRAVDPNGDDLMYDLFYRAGSTGSWLKLAEKLTRSRYTWDVRMVRDGRYQVKVVASDALSNPPGQERTDSRVSDPVTLDTTPPVIGDIRWTRRGEAIELSYRVVDRTSTIAESAYRLDVDEHWQAVFPSDKIFDGPAESVVVRITGFGPAARQVTIRATDVYGNCAYETLTIGGDPTPPTTQTTTRKEK